MVSKCLIGGEWIAAESSQSIPVYNPATDELIGSVPDCREAETARAIASASNALPSWRHTPVAERCQLLLELVAIIRSRKEQFASQLTGEQGKPLKEARVEIDFGLSLIEWFAQEATRIRDEAIENPRPHHRAQVQYEPVGVCAAITPWNFPFAMVARKVAPALAVGCPVILKPAPETPMTALLFAAATIDAGIPAGVFNCITGDAATIADVLMKSPVIRKMSFTGSTAVGKLLIRQSADTVKKLTLELGGNAPFIVFDDADIPRAVQATLWAKYRNAGQACVGVNRFLVHAAIYQTFLEQYKQASAALKVGNGVQDDSDIGPLISVRSVERIRGLVLDALDKGADLVLGEVPEQGTRWMRPLILSGVTAGMRIWGEEIFGPVSAIRTFRDEAEVIAMANDTVHGLASYLFSGSAERCERMVPQLQSGMVCVNDFSLAGAQIPFGGIKESGFGVEGGRQALYQFLQSKYVTTGP